MKKLVLNATLISALMAGAAYAQTSTSPAPNAPSMDRPATSAPGTPSTAPADRGMAPSTGTAPRANAPSTTSTAANTSASDWRASKLIGSAVFNQQNERIGDINELLLDNSGKVAQVVIGVGGFLGMGEHEVAVPFTDLRMAMDGSTMKVSSNFTKQSLQAMPRWTWDNTNSAAPARR
jgi:hypothetical protein